MFSFKSCFWHEPQPAGPINKIKKVNFSKEKKGNANARDVVAPSGQKWRNKYGFY